MEILAAGINEQMAKEAKMNVYLVGHTNNPEEVVGVAIRRCYSDKPAVEIMESIMPEKRSELIKMVQSTGHTSTVEHAGFNFAVEGISRAAAQQLTRHRLASYSMESMRYVDLSKKELEVVVPKSIKRNPKAYEIYMERADEAEVAYKKLLALGIKPEDARGTLGLDTECKLVFTMNARELTETFFPERLCLRTQGEMRSLAIGMAKLVKPVAPNLFENIGPTCLTEGVCWEGGRACNLWKVIEGAELKIREKHKFKKGIRNDLSFLNE